MAVRKRGAAKKLCPVCNGLGFVAPDKKCADCCGSGMVEAESEKKKKTPWR